MRATLLTTMSEDNASIGEIATCAVIDSERADGVPNLALALTAMSRGVKFRRGRDSEALRDSIVLQL